jgi:hypothetical protein
MDSAKQKTAATTTYIQSISKEAYQSHSYTYPILGIYFFFSHPHLWPPLLKILFPSLALSIGVLFFMFAFTYLPQAAVLSIVQLGPLGFVSAIPLVLSESALIINTVAKMFIIPDAITEEFDLVLIEKGQTKLVEKGRVVEGPGKKLGKVLTKPLERFSPSKYVLSPCRPR